MSGENIPHPDLGEESTGSVWCLTDEHNSPGSGAFFSAVRCCVAVGSRAGCTSLLDLTAGHKLCNTAFEQFYIFYNAAFTRRPMPQDLVSISRRMFFVGYKIKSNVSLGCVVGLLQGAKVES